jgi:hypothetical protein
VTRFREVTFCISNGSGSAFRDSKAATRLALCPAFGSWLLVATTLSKLSAPARANIVHLIVRVGGRKVNDERQVKQRRRASYISCDLHGYPEVDQSHVEQKNWSTRFHLELRT